MEKPLRILIVTYKMQCAGIESFIMNMYRNIDRTKIQFDFLVHYTQRQFYDDEIENMGGKIYRLSIREDNDFLKYFKDLKSFFRNHPEYKIVHGHMESFGIFYLRAAKKAGVPVRIAHSHIGQKNKGIKGALKGILNKGFKTYATDLFACSDTAGQFVFGKRSKFTIYNNAIDAESFSYNKEVRKDVREQLGLSPDQLVVGHVGRFNTQKNHEFLIDIFAELFKKKANSILLLIGEGELQKKIEDKVSVLGLQKAVRFLGVRDDVNRLYQAMDIFLMPSLFEGLPVSGIEAQASGLKCIFSDQITKETDLTGNVKFFPLESTARAWADMVEQWGEGYTRECQIGKIIAAGYDIKNQAAKLQQFYLKAVI